ncbi:hypothetical protein H8R18_06105 [Nanchangia anserum]|uniref:Aldose 1-epimerase n=1 Tax=Nanchangia anserum TaxID=2692125 RepID=A0A8I0GBH2_9ACTO|nr:hypothetical protein [Nanchangia anserum]MBD3689110.1 hypothetical protein [Nanchangia anserum]QOX81345.1 hypothetical protein H8R18_06105 [Nanchangia anserum]
MAAKTWELRSGDDRAVISASGAVALSWVVARDDGECELLDGYRDSTEHAELHGYRNAVLAPWSNRIRDARFGFGGRDVDLGPDEAGVREALHGLVCGNDFVELVAEEDRVVLASQIAAGEYPWSLQVHVEYRLVGVGAHRLDMEMRVANTGHEEAPVTLGWHPYLRHLGPKELGSIRVPAATIVRNDAANVPLPADAAFVSARDAIGADGRVCDTETRASIIGGDIILAAPAGLDHAFTDLHRDGDGWARAEVTHGDGSRVLVEFAPEQLGRGVGVFHVFTGEVVPERAGESVAVEPCLMMTDAFNRDECADVIGLAPGAVRTLRAGLVFSETAS